MTAPTDRELLFMLYGFLKGNKIELDKTMLEELELQLFGEEAK